MFRVRNAFRIGLLVLCPVWLGACAITAPESPDLVTREAALARWTQCLQQFTANYQGTFRTVQRSANLHCDGHRRDVLATFPGHLENQVDAILSQRSRVMTTARFVRTGTAERWIGNQGSQLDIFRTRLREAQKADL